MPQPLAVSMPARPRTTETMTATAHCQRCSWTAAGTWIDADKAAEKHTKTTRHPTATIATPAAKGTAR